MRSVAPRLWVLVASVSLLLGSIAVRREVRAHQAPRDPGGTPPITRTRIHALARLEPASGVISIGARPGARIEDLPARPGDSVKKGAILAVLEGHDAARRQLDLAKVQKKVAEEKRSRERDRLALARERIDRLTKAREQSVGPDVLAARKRFEAVVASYQKLENLQGKERFDADVAYHEAELQNIKSTLELKEYQVDKEFLPRQRALEDKALATGGGEDELLDRQIDLAQAQVEQTTVRAPLGGKVLEVLAHAGEVSLGPILILGDTSAMVAVAELDQADIGQLRLGAGAEVMIHDRPVHGKVSRIGALVGVNQLRNVDPRAPLDLRVLKVCIGLDDSTAAENLVNMQVDVAIDSNSPASSP